MSEIKSHKSKIEELESDDLLAVDGELIEDFRTENQDLSESKKQETIPVITDKNQKSKTKKQPPKQSVSQSVIRHYLLLPIIFLTVTLLGGLRLSDGTNAFIFLKPALVCLIFAVILVFLFFRTSLIRLEGWFSEDFTTVKNISNAVVLFTLFTSSVQIFNALLPEQGLPFWIVALLFFWTLWNNLFSGFTAERLVQSLASLFGLAFVLKYLILANLTAPNSESWLRALIENPTKEVFTYLLDLPKYSAGTGYVQFFTVIFYVVGLFLLSPTSKVKSA